MISWIASGFFESSPFLAYAVAGLTIQLTVFCAVSLRALFTDADTLEARSCLPLNDEEEDGHE